MFPCFSFHTSSPFSELVGMDVGWSNKKATKCDRGGGGGSHFWVTKFQMEMLFKHYNIQKVIVFLFWSFKS